MPENKADTSPQTKERADLITAIVVRDLMDKITGPAKPDHSPNGHTPIPENTGSFRSAPLRLPRYFGPSETQTLAT